MDYISNRKFAFSVTLMPTHKQRDLCKYLMCI